MAATNGDISRDRLWLALNESDEPAPSSIFRLAYVSEVSTGMSEKDFRQIEAKSAEKNSQLDITGLLLVDEYRIMQILEGEEAAVRALTAVIAADPRHHAVKICVEGRHEERFLHTWNMVLREVLNAPEDIRFRFREMYEEFRKVTDPVEISENDLELFEVIALFGSIPSA